MKPRDRHFLWIAVVATLVAGTLCIQQGEAHAEPTGPLTEARSTKCSVGKPWRRAYHRHEPRMPRIPPWLAMPP